MRTVLTELENFLVFALCDMLNLEFGTIGCAWDFSSVKIQHETYQNSNWLLLLDYAALNHVPWTIDGFL